MTSLRRGQVEFVKNRKFLGNFLEVYGKLTKLSMKFREFSWSMHLVAPARILQFSLVFRSKNHEKLMIKKSQEGFSCKKCVHN